MGARENKLLRSFTLCVLAHASHAMRVRKYAKLHSALAACRATDMDWRSDQNTEICRPQRMDQDAT